MQVSEPLTLASARPGAGRPAPLAAVTAAGSSSSMGSGSSMTTSAQTVTDVRAFHWSYNTLALGPYAHIAPVMFDGVLAITMTSHFLDQAQIDGFLRDVYAMLTESA